MSKRNSARYRKMNRAKRLKKNALAKQKKQALTASKTEDVAVSENIVDNNDAMDDANISKKEYPTIEKNEATVVEEEQLSTDVINEVELSSIKDGEIVDSSHLEQDYKENNTEDDSEVLSGEGSDDIISSGENKGVEEDISTEEDENNFELEPCTIEEELAVEKEDIEVLEEDVSSSEEEIETDILRQQDTADSEDGHFYGEAGRGSCEEEQDDRDVQSNVEFISKREEISDSNNTINEVSSFVSSEDNNNESSDVSESFSNEEIEVPEKCSKTIVEDKIENEGEEPKEQLDKVSKTEEEIIVEPLSDNNVIQQDDISEQEDERSTEYDKSEIEDKSELVVANTGLGEKEEDVTGSFDTDTIVKELERHRKKQQQQKKIENRHNRVRKILLDFSLPIIGIVLALAGIIGYIDWVATIGVFLIGMLWFPKVIKKCKRYGIGTSILDGLKYGWFRILIAIALIAGGVCTILGMGTINNITTIWAGIIIIIIAFEIIASAIVKYEWEEY